MNEQELLLNITAELGLRLSEQQLHQFSIYLAELTDWNKRVNLTAITEPQEIVTKHFVDSLTCGLIPYFSATEKLIDVGTGAGFPGLPLKIAFPGLEVTLLDSLQKRITFLQHLVSLLDLKHVNCIHGRAEEAARQALLRESFDIAVSRAVADLAVLAELCLPFVKLGGYFLAMKGSEVDNEVRAGEKAVKELGGELTEIIKFRLPVIDAGRAILVIKKSAVTPDQYPRRAGVPGKKPIR